MIKEKLGTIIPVTGLQFGSESKGEIAAYICTIASMIVRTGAANAGHTIGPYIMRQIPCGCIHPHVKLVIGKGAQISLHVLLPEIEMIEKVLSIKRRLYIDAHAMVITQDQIDRERATGLASAIASTSAKAGLGIGIAAADRAMRDPRCMFAKDVPELKDYISDTIPLMLRELHEGGVIVLEGTQGFGLSLFHGTFPYTTSRDATVTSLLAEAGLPGHAYDVRPIGVARTFPIRVGGNSGPFDDDSEEVDWEYVRKFSGAPHDITEKTSVTKTVRRVATFSWQGIKRACEINAPSEIALTFLDHIDHSVYEQETLSSKIEDFIERLEDWTGIPVGIVKTGPRTLIDRDWMRSNMFRKVAQ